MTTTKFAGSGSAANSNSDVLEEGNVAVSITVDSARGVSGLVQPGDYVNLSLNLVAVDAEGNELPEPTTTPAPATSTRR